MAISEEIVTSLVEAVAALNLRVNDAASRPMIQGPQGEAGPQGERGEDAPPVSDQQIKDAAENWLRNNITQPKDGQDGQDGQQGPEGRAPTDEEIQAAVNIWFDLNRETLRGRDGRNGVDGADGSAGRDGTNGRDGRNGSNGADGVGIALVEQRDDKSFWITLTDGQETQIELPVAKPLGSFGGGGGGIRTITSEDGSVIISVDGTNVDLSVVGGGGPTATRLSDLQDVEISNVADGNVLSYETSLNKWRNEARENLVDGGNF